MKKWFIISNFIFIGTNLFGQSLFFDNLKNSTWVAVSSWNDSVVRKAREIPIGKLVSKDSLKQNVTLWNFKDSTLMITYYDFKSKKETEVVTYKIVIDGDRGTLRIIPSDSNAMIFNAGITAIGSNAILFRKKNRPKQR